MRLPNIRIMIPLALFAGLFVSYLVYHMIVERENTIRSSYGNELVVVAARNLPMGTTLVNTDMVTKKWPRNLLLEGYCTSYDELSGRVIRSDVLGGEPILLSKLTPTGSGGGVVGLIPPGMRAMTVAVNIVSGVGGFILPQSRVDILTTVSGGGREQSVTKTILQDVMVIAIDQTYKRNDYDPVTVKSVTLLVNPQEAENLALASTEGRLQLSLRNTSDSKLVPTSGVRLNTLLTDTRAPNKPIRKVVTPPKIIPIEPKPIIVEVIRSMVRSEIKFEEEDQLSK